MKPSFLCKTATRLKKRCKCIVAEGEADQPHVTERHQRMYINETNQS